MYVCTSWKSWYDLIGSFVLGPRSHCIPHFRLVLRAVGTTLHLYFQRQSNDYANHMFAVSRTCSFNHIPLHVEYNVKATRNPHKLNCCTCSNTGRRRSGGCSDDATTTTGHRRPNEPKPLLLAQKMEANYSRMHKAGKETAADWN